MEQGEAVQGEKCQRQSIRVVYPRDGHQTAEANTFVMGMAPAGEALFINGSTVSVNAQGFFAHPVPLTVGENHLTLATGLNDEQTVMTITRTGPVPALPPGQVEVLFPAAQGCVALQPGQSVSLVLRVPPETVSVAVTIEGVLPEPVNLQRCAEAGDWDNRENIFGQLHQMAPLVSASTCFEGTLSAPIGAKGHLVPVVALLTNHHQGVVAVQTLLLVSVWPSARWGKAVSVTPDVGGDRLIVRSGPTGNASRLSPLLPEALVKVSAQQGAWYQIHYSQTHTGWIHQDNLHFEEGRPLFPQPLRQLLFTVLASRHLKIALPLPHPVPVAMCAQANQLTLTLHGVVWHGDVVKLPDFEWTDGFGWQMLDAESLQLTLNVKDLCGVDYGHDGTHLWFILKTRPQSLEQLTVLIDPGHGGRELGSTGLDGQYEKDLNLAVSLQLATALTQLGVGRVVLTREADEAVSLTHRHRAAVDDGADVVLSLHHNALPDGRNPADFEGYGLYYYHDFALPLARCLDKALAKVAPRDGLYYDSLALTRIHQASAVLVELGYFTHPDEYARLINPAAQGKLVAALAKGLQSWVEQTV